MTATVHAYIVFVNVGKSSGEAHRAACAVSETCEGHVLPAQTESAVERDAHQKACLSLTEAEPCEGADAFIERHDKICGSRELVLRLDVFNAFDAIIFNTRIATVQLTNSIDQTVTNSQYLPSGKIDPVRVDRTPSRWTSSGSNPELAG